MNDATPLCYLAVDGDKLCTSSSGAVPCSYRPTAHGGTLYLWITVDEAMCLIPEIMDLWEDRQIQMWSINAEDWPAPVVMPARLQAWTLETVMPAMYHLTLTLVTLRKGQFFLPTPEQARSPRTGRPRLS